MGTEALLWFVLREDSPSNAAEAAMMTYHVCLERGGRELAVTWLSSLRSLGVWESLVSQDFFRRWASQMLPNCAGVGRVGEIREFETNEPEARHTSVSASSEDEFLAACSQVSSL